MSGVGMNAHPEHMKKLVHPDRLDLRNLHVSSVSLQNTQAPSHDLPAALWPIPNHLNRVSS
jgi:hypothetical protein